MQPNFPNLTGQSFLSTSWHHTHTHTQIFERRHTPRCRRNFVPCLFLPPDPVSQAPRWCWLSAELLQEFHQVYLRERESEREKERQEEEGGDRGQWNRQTGEWTARATRRWVTATQAGERKKRDEARGEEGVWGSGAEHDRTKMWNHMICLTQSHLIDCPLLLCNLWRLEFWKGANAVKSL